MGVSKAATTEEEAEVRVATAMTWGAAPVTRLAAMGLAVAPGGAAVAGTAAGPAADLRLRLRALCESSCH